MRLQEQIAADIEGWDAIGEHRTGTSGDRRTSAWLADLVGAAGVASRLDEFKLQRWTLRSCTVRVGAKTVAGIPLFDGGTTDGIGVAAPLRTLPNAQPGIGLGTLGPAAGSEANRAIASARAANECPALVAVAKMDANLTGLALQNADRFSDPFGPPVLQVATEHEAWLQAEARRGSRAHVTVDAAMETATASNVVARVAGSDSGLSPLFVITPKSSWWTSTAERSGGIAIWLALARHFAANRPRRDVHLIATSGHELGHLGLKHHLRASPPAAVHAWIHLGANFAAQGSRVRLQTSTNALRTAALDAMAKAGTLPADETPPGTRPGGEARDIFDRGEPYVSFLGSNRWFHHPDDRWPTTIDLQTATRLTEAMLAIASSLANR